MFGLRPGLPIPSEGSRQSGEYRARARAHARARMTGRNGDVNERRIVQSSLNKGERLARGCVGGGEDEAERGRRAGEGEEEAGGVRGRAKVHGTKPLSSGWQSDRGVNGASLRIPAVFVSSQLAIN